MNKPSLTFLSIFFLLFIETINCTAQEKQKRGSAFMLYLNTPSATIITSEKSDEYEIGRTSWMADFGLEYKFRGIATLSGGVGIGDIKDNNSFTQNTNMGEMESSFTTYSYNVKSGIWIPEFSIFPQRDLHVAIGTNLGIEGLAGKREIENCSNCSSEDFSFSGGLFAEPEVNFFFYQDILGVGTSYRYYFTSSDLEYKIVLLKLILRINQPAK